MFVRTSTRRNRDGSKVSYLQLAHNEWDPTAKTARTKVLYSFGRADQLDRPAIERLIAALTRVVGVEPAAVGPDRARAVGVPGLPVDRHVLRVANRLGIARSADPVVVERQLGAALPKARWTLASDTLILHGRRICKPRPLCDRCRARPQCLYVAEGGHPPAKRGGGRSRRQTGPRKTTSRGTR